MLIKYNIDFLDITVEKRLKMLLNQIYKLLPIREEGLDWTKPLSTIIEELAGMNRLLIDLQDDLFPILCKMEGLYNLTREEDYELYRRTIFDCLNLTGALAKKICQV